MEQRLIDANAVLKRLDDLCKNCENNDGILCEDCDLAETISYVKEAPTIGAQPVMSDWIKCSERMPPIGKDVLVYVRTWYSHNVQFAYRYSESIWSIPQHCGVNNDSVSHWMPLPDPPKEVDEDEQAQ